MNKIICSLLCMFMCCMQLVAQSNIITGIISDEQKHPLEGASVVLNDTLFSTMTNTDGLFSFSNLRAQKYKIKVMYVGYADFVDTVFISKKQSLQIELKEKSNRLKEVVITDNYQVLRQRESSVSLQIVDKKYLDTHAAGSLMQTLSNLPGISSMNIGSGQSKPVIRGLGFNRVVVVENGIKHDGQEWGADHGLEVDQFSIERVNVIKGPASLMYGANAIGGVIDIQKYARLLENTWGASIDYTMQSNNDLVRLSALYFKFINKFYIKINFSISDYADYRVPTDSIEFMSYIIKLKNKQLRNTAGKEASGNVTLGYITDNFTNYLNISDVYNKSGFFANAHGLEIRLSTIDYDKSSRDIDLPYQQVNHFSVVNNSVLKLSSLEIHSDIAMQHNHRQEFAEAVSHGYMPIPADSQERLYDKKSYTWNIRTLFNHWNNHALQVGINANYQENKIGGWGFIIPEYSNIETGIFAYDKYTLNSFWSFNAGLRYDIGKLNTQPYYDWFTTPTENGNVYTQRAEKIVKTFQNLSWALGLNYNNNGYALRLNIGKSFRMPTAKELASNGMNYHYFRVEKGNANLDAEQSYQFDLGFSKNTSKFGVDISPFVNYFPNFIFLNPSSDYVNAQQIYYYTQSEVLRAGGEISAHYNLIDNITISANAEYVYSVQLSGDKRGYNLPFAPPFKNTYSIAYAPKGNKLFSHPSIEANMVWALAQNDIVPPEKTTPGYKTINLLGSVCINLGSLHPTLNLQIQNLFDTKYFDHSSFYRLIDVPAQGRNIVVSIQLPLN